MARIYANENFPFPSVEELRRLGHDVLTTYESGKAGQRLSDDDVLAFAVAERRAVLTHNRRHFIRLHQKNAGHCGIVVCTVDANAVALANRIHDSIEAAGDLEGKLLRIDRPVAQTPVAGPGEGTRGILSPSDVRISNNVRRARRLQDSVREALMKFWDPIGVAGVAEAHDEYDGYIHQICGMLMRREPKYNLVDYLWWAETEHMGLAGNRTRTEVAAEQLLAILEDSSQ